MSPDHPLSASSTPPLSRMSRWKLDQPVRFYLWPAIAVLAVALAVDLPGFLADVTLRSAALVLLLLAVEAARATHAATLQLIAAALERNR